MHKKSLADLRALCAANGYTGKDDAASMKAWAVEQNFALVIDGSEVEIKDIEFADDKPRKVVSLPAQKSTEPAATKPEPVDLDLKIKAAVSETLKGLNVGQPTRPGAAGGAVTHVKSMEQRMYEDRIKQFSGKSGKSVGAKPFFADYETALLFKSYFAQQYTGALGNYEAADQHRAKFLKLHEDIVGKAYSTTSVTGGAALMPELFVPDLIRNVNEAGIARKLAKVIQMPVGKVVIPRRTGGTSGAFQTENSAVTASNATYDNVTLDAETYISIAIASEQAISDAGLSIIDLTMQEFATEIAQKEDDCLLIGDGTATYGGMTGFESTSKYGTTATDGGNVVVGGADATAHTHAQLCNAIARVPGYARKNMVITCTPTIKSTIFDRLATATAGGMTLTELVGFGLVDAYMNVPIIQNYSMSSVTDAGSTARGKGFTAGDQIDFLIGDFSRACLFGDRMAVEMSMSRERGFDAYSVYLRAVDRFDTVVHSVGTSSTAGPVVSFWQT